MTAERERAWRYMVVTAALFMALDQATKQLVVHSLERGESPVDNVAIGEQEAAEDAMADPGERAAS